MCNFKRPQGRFWIFGVVFLLGSVANHVFADSDTAEPVTQSENTTSISSGAIVGKQMDIPVFDVSVSSRKGVFPFEIASDELRSFVGIREVGSVSGLSPLDNQIGDERFSEDRDKYVSGSYKLIFSQDGYLEKIIIVLRNISGKNAHLYQRVVPVPSISFFSSYMNSGPLDISENYRKDSPDSELIGFRSYFPADSQRVWIFDVRDLLVKDQALVHGMVSEVAFSLELSIFDKETNQHVPVSFWKKMKNVPLKLPVAFEEFHEFDKEAFYRRNFSDLGERVKKLPRRGENKGGLPR